MGGLISKYTLCLTSTETIRLIRDGGTGTSSRLFKKRVGLSPQFSPRRVYSV